MFVVQKTEAGMQAPFNWHLFAKNSIISVSYMRFMVCTYTHNWALQLFTQDCNLACHTTYVVYVNFIRNLQFNVLVMSSPTGLFSKILKQISADFISSSLHAKCLAYNNLLTSLQPAHIEILYRNGLNWWLRMTYNLKSTSNERFWKIEKLFLGNFIYPHSFCQEFAEGIWHIFSYFV